MVFQSILMIKSTIQELPVTGYIHLYELENPCFIKITKNNQL